MKRILFFAVLSVLCNVVYSQVFYNGSPGFVGGPELDDITGNPVNSSTVKSGTPLKLKMGFQNVSFSTKIPNSTIRIQIDLGTSLVINSSANYVLAKAPFNKIFLWTLSTNGGDQVITGIQKAGADADIPPGFIDYLQFEVQSSAPGKSTVLGNIMIPNTNTSEKTSDPIDNDNSTSLIYSVIESATNFSNITIQNRDCNINLNWIANSQANVSKYEIEASKNDTAYTSVAIVNTHSSSSYTASFPVNEKLRSNMIYVRIKQITADGKFTYSPVLTVSAACDVKKKPA